MAPSRGTGWLRSWQQRALQERDLRERISSHLLEDDEDQERRLRSWLPAIGCTAVILAGMGVAVWVFIVTAPSTTSTLPQARRAADVPPALSLGPDFGNVGVDLLTRGQARNGRVNPDDRHFDLRRLPGPAPSPSPSRSTPPTADRVEPAPRPRPTRTRDRAPEQPKQEQKPDKPNENRDRKPEKPEPEKADELATLEIEVVDEPVELALRDQDGKVLASGLQHVGWRGQFTAAQIEIWVDDRRRVKFWVGGKPWLPEESEEQELHHSFELDDYSGAQLASGPDSEVRPDGA